MKITLRGSTRVVKNHLEDDEEDIDDPEILKMIASKESELQSLYDEDSAFSQYCHDGSEMAKSLADRITLGGWVRLVFDDADNTLVVETSYESTDDLSEEEIQFMVRETVGQWRDGAGGAAMDDFCEFIQPFYVELNEFDPKSVEVTLE